MRHAGEDDVQIDKNSVGHQVKFSPGWKQLVELTKNCVFAYIINPEFLSEVLLYQTKF